MINEKLWERKKAEIEYNVANRPLLVELQSQHFCDKLNEIRQVENFVQVLWEAKLDPQDHLEPWQKELLASAEYLDWLNASTAYFPTVNTAVLQREPIPEQEGEEEGEIEGEDYPEEQQE